MLAAWDIETAVISDIGAAFLARASFFLRFWNALLTEVDGRFGDGETKTVMRERR